MNNKSFNCESVKTVVFNGMRQEVVWGSRSLIENDPTWDSAKFFDEVNNWTYDKMLEGLDLGYNEEGYTPAA